jgi:hypothetical protein
MPLFKNSNNEFVLYIHIPKTGGTTIQKLIGYSFRYIGVSDTRSDLPCSPQHFHKELLDQVGYSVIASNSFAIVREPFERILSEFKYRKKNSSLVRFFMDFDSFVLFNFLEYKKNKYILDNHIRPQSHFLLSDTTIFQLERGLVPIVKMLSEVHGAELLSESLHTNKSTKENILICPSTYNRILDFYNEDYKVLGYIRPESKNVTKLNRVKYLFVIIKAGLLSFFYSTFHKFLK